ncbi:DUF4489 domain-containing protein [Cytobacillus sp. Hm23]
MTKINESFVKCGKVYDPKLPNDLDVSEPPIILGEVTIDPKQLKNPCVLVKFSEFINFEVVRINPKLDIIYRLTRKMDKQKYAQILEEWKFEFESAEVLEVANLETSQPTVLNFCDCLKSYCSEVITYTLEIIQIKTNNVTKLGITNKSIIATVMNSLANS